MGTEKKTEEDRERTVTVWSRFSIGKTWMIERSYPLHYVQDGLGLGSYYAILRSKGRDWIWCEKGENPNG